MKPVFFLFEHMLEKNYDLFLRDFQRLFARLVVFGKWNKKCLFFLTKQKYIFENVASLFQS